jgi:hypothetical protein
MKPTIKILGTCLFLFLSYSAFSQCETFFGDLVINEVMAANNNTAADPAGEYDDWVEIYNSTENAINLEGFFLSDSEGNETKYTFPDVEIEANGFLIVWCDNQIEQEGLHAPFSLSADGEEVVLSNPDTVSLDFVRYGPLPDDISIGRFPNGAGPFNVLIPTFDSFNSNSVNPGLVINEYQADNESTASEQWGEFADWIELYNNSNQPIDLTGYFLSDKIGDPTIFEFPDTTIQANDYMIIWCDQGLMEPGLHTFFRLGNDGDDILLSDADTLTIDYVRFGLQIPDDSEGRFSNGVGPIECMIPTFSASNGQVNGLFENKGLAPFEIWPNPAENALWVRHSGISKVDVQIFDVQGRKLNSIQIQNGDNRIDISALNRGVYILRSDERMAKFVVK